MARLLTENGVLYQHIPRTGGTWVEQALQRMRIPMSRWLQKQPEWMPKKHCLLSHYFREDMGQVKRVVAFVRHPLAYYSAVWRWLCDRKPKHFETVRSGEKWAWHPHRTAAEQCQPCFNDWVFLMLQREPLWYTRLVEQYVGPEHGEFCDYIGRTETLADDVLASLGLFGYGTYVEKWKAFLWAMPRENVAAGEVKWSKDLRAKVVESERKVIERFYGNNEGRRFYAGLAQEEAEAVAAGPGR
jgi:hypothetical protein